jgi:hypothetical protein
VAGGLGNCMIEFRNNNDKLGKNVEMGHVPSIREAFITVHGDADDKTISTALS